MKVIKFAISMALVSFGVTALGVPSLNGTYSTAAPVALPLVSASEIIDTTGAAWTLGKVGTPQSGFVYKNGIKDPTSANVSLLLFFNNILYQQNDSGNWWYYTGSAWAGHGVIGDPRVTSADGAVANATGAAGTLQIVDNAVPTHHVWVVDSAGDIYKDGVKDPNSYNVSLVMYYQNSVYQQNHAGNYYEYYGVSWRGVVNPKAAISGVSISKYAKCDGKTDDSLAAAAAFLAAQGNAFTLIIDCPVYIKIGTDITRPIFIRDNTTVVFEPKGQIIVDNIMQPAFVIANSSNISISYRGPTTTNLQFLYTGSVTIDSRATAWATAGSFSGTTLQTWYKNNKQVVGSTPFWPSPTNVSGLFYIMGPASNIAFTNLNIGAQPTAIPYNFIPVVFSFAPGFKSNQTVTHAESVPPLSSAYIGMPQNIRFSNVSLDGTIMGFVGSLQNSSFYNITSNRYSDYQDQNGNYVGGIGSTGISCATNSADCPWAPPHLFYFTFDTANDPKLANTGIDILGVLDKGVRLGTPRNSTSGNTLSLKFGAYNSLVDSYVSRRKDGFLDMPVCNDVVLSNSSATYDSSYIIAYWPNNWAWPAVRFPSPNATPIHENTTFDNVTVTDLAPTTSSQVFAALSGATNLVFKDTNIFVRNWSSTSALAASISSQGAGSLRTYKNQTTGSTMTIDANNAIVVNP